MMTRVCSGEGGTQSQTVSRRMAGSDFDAGFDMTEFEDILHAHTSGALLAPMDTTTRGLMDRVTSVCGQVLCHKRSMSHALRGLSLRLWLLSRMDR